MMCSSSRSPPIGLVAGDLRWPPPALCDGRHSFSLELASRNDRAARSPWHRNRNRVLASCRARDHIHVMNLHLSIALAATVLAVQPAPAQTVRAPTVRPPAQSYDHTFRELGRPKYAPNPYGNLSIRSENGALRERLLG